MGGVFIVSHNLHVTSLGHCILRDFVGLWVLLTWREQGVNIFVLANPVRRFLAISLAPFGMLSCRQQICILKNMGLCLPMCYGSVWWMLNCVIPWCNISGDVFPPIPSVLSFFFFEEKCQFVNGTMSWLEEHVLFSHFILAFANGHDVMQRLLQGIYFLPPLGHSAENSGLRGTLGSL